MLHRATQDGRVLVESSDKMWSTGEGNGKPLPWSCLKNPMNSMKRQKDRTLKAELPRLVGAQYATRDQWRNNFRKNGDGAKAKTTPIFLLRQSLPSGSFHKPLILLHQRADRMKTTITEN